MNITRVSDSVSIDDRICYAKLFKVVIVDVFYLEPYWLSLKSSFFRKILNLLLHNFFTFLTIDAINKLADIYLI